jgi:hypothetical protein
MWTLTSPHSEVDKAFRVFKAHHLNRFAWPLFIVSLSNMARHAWLTLSDPVENHPINFVPKFVVCFLNLLWVLMRKSRFKEYTYLIYLLTYLVLCVYSVCLFSNCFAVFGHPYKGQSLNDALFAIIGPFLVAIMGMNFDHRIALMFLSPLFIGSMHLVKSSAIKFMPPEQIQDDSDEFDILTTSLFSTMYGLLFVGISYLN